MYTETFIVAREVAGVNVNTSTRSPERAECSYDIGEERGAS